CTSGSVAKTDKRNPGGSLDLATTSVAGMGPFVAASVLNGLSAGAWGVLVLTGTRPIVKDNNTVVGRRNAEKALFEASIRDYGNAGFASSSGTPLCGLRRARK